MSGIRDDDKKYMKLMKEYHNSHRNCPECGSLPSYSTYMGYILDLRCPQNYKDLNTVKCDCGWKGIVHDLVGHDNEKE